MTTPHRCDNCDGIDPASCINAPTLRHQLVRLRQQHGISQAELAQRIGVTQTAVSYWETGRRQPGLDDVERWASALGATPSLLQGSPTAGSNEPGDLRERLTEALTREHYRRAAERIEASVEEHCAGFADAVLPVVEAETAALRERVETAERDVKREKAAHRMATQHAANADAREAEAEAEAARTQARYATERAARLREQAERLETERQRDDYRQRFANQMTAATELTTTLREAERKLQQALEAIADERRGRLAAEAAVRRAREMAENEEERVARGFGYQFGGRPFPASILTRDVLAALDAEQPKETR